MAYTNAWHVTVIVHSNSHKHVFTKTKLCVHMKRSIVEGILSAQTYQCHFIHQKKSQLFCSGAVGHQKSSSPWTTEKKRKQTAFLHTLPPIFTDTIKKPNRSSAWPQSSKNVRCKQNERERYKKKFRKFTQFYDFMMTSQRLKEVQIKFICCFFFCSFHSVS